LRDQDVSEDWLREAAEEARAGERSRGRISSPDQGDGDLKQAASSAPRLLRLSRVLDRLADELASGREGAAYSLMVDGDGLIAQGRRAWVFDDQRLLLLDGTANAEVLRQFVPQLRDVPEILVQRNAHVIQVRDLTFYRHSLVEEAPPGEAGAGWRPKARLGAVAQFIERVAQDRRTLVVTNKRVRCAMTGENPGARLPVSGRFAGADIAHFGNIRGTNDFENHEVVIILGREQPSPRDAERRAMAIWYDAKRPIRQIRQDGRGQAQYPYRERPYTIRDRTRRQVRVRVHPDRRVQAVVEQVREAEMVQAIDRLRLIHGPRRKTVHILCNIPLDIPVDELVTWRELVGDGRLARVLEACEENGWEALPLAPEKLSELLPEIWGTEDAAEAWLRKNRLNPLISIIRLWAVFVDYKPRRQRRWSRALVRHGADPRMALARVLDLSPADIQVREGSGSNGLATADAVPRPSPSNPNPNTEAAVQPNNAGPDFPSGGN
jgi:hypothetical protein